MVTDTPNVPPRFPTMPVDPLGDLIEVRKSFATLSPQARVAGWLDGSVPRIPVMTLFGVNPRDAEGGTSTADLEIRPDMLGADGCLPPGLLAYLTDVLAGTAISCVADRRPMVTVTITVEPVVDDLPTEGFLTGRAKVVSTRGDRIFAQGEIRSASKPGEHDGRLVARVGSWFLVLSQRPGFAPKEPPTMAPPQPGSAPLRDVGLGPVGQLLGVTSLEGTPGAAQAVLPMRPELMNLSLLLHGGVGALYADLVCAAALGGGTYRPLTSTYSYLRSAGADGKDVGVRARVLKPGRAVATVEAEILTDEGKPALHVVTNASRVLSGPIA
jgi:uncharacterized protein (TIGR00369 family)